MNGLEEMPAVQLDGPPIVLPFDSVGEFECVDLERDV